MTKGTLTARLTGVTSKTELLAELSRQLGFPDYFGANWDALYDCLTDLGWLDADITQVVLRHEDIPKLPPHELATYRELLRDAAQQWQRSDESRRIRVHFPDEERRAP